MRTDTYSAFSPLDSGFGALTGRVADTHPDRAQRLAMRYDTLKARLLALNEAPHKNMEAIDGVIALLANTQLALRLLNGKHDRQAF